jgi:cell division transport system ATP-binding protein
MIVFEKATKQFGDNPPSIEEVSFFVEDGEFVFLTGHSGSGKTTLLKLLTKEYLLSDGEILFDGQQITKIKTGKVHHHRRKIGVVYQDYRLLPELNVWENVAIALEIVGKPQHEIEERVTDLLELVQLTDKAFFFPAELSGGESQRVGIARALATAPNLLLADEPTGNLDPENTLMIARLFSKIHDLGTTVLFATHDLSVLEHLGHRRLKMEKGKLIEDKPATGKNSEKLSKPKVEEEVAKAAPIEPETVKTEEKPVEKPQEVQQEKVAEAQKEQPTPSTQEKPPAKVTPPESKSDPEQKPEQEKTKPGFHFSLFGKKKAADEKKPTQEKLAQTTKPSVDIMIEEL